MEVEKRIESTDGYFKFIGAFTSSCSEGPKIYYQHWQPKKMSEKCIHLVIVHDLGSYHARYINLAKYLVKNCELEVAISFIDLLGHGLSGGERCYTSNFDNYCHDLSTLLKQRSSKNNFSKEYVLGDGLGALVTLKLMKDFESSLKPTINGIVLINPFIKIDLLKNFVKSLIYININQKFDKIRVDRNFRGKDITNCTVESDLYDSDPLISDFYTVGLLRELNNASKSIRSFSYFIEIPSLVLLSDETILADYDVNLLFFKGMCPSFAEILKYKNKKHNILNDEEKESVYNDICNWLTKSTI